MSRPAISVPRMTAVSDDEADLGDYLRGPVRGVAGGPVPNPLEINGAPAVEAAHEYVIGKKSKTNA